MEWSGREGWGLALYVDTGIRVAGEGVNALSLRPSLRPVAGEAGRRAAWSTGACADSQEAERSHAAPKAAGSVSVMP